MSSPLQLHPIGVVRSPLRTRDILEVAPGPRLRVAGLEAFDGTPVLELAARGFADVERGELTRRGRLMS